MGLKEAKQCCDIDNSDICLDSVINFDVFFGKF